MYDAARGIAGFHRSLALTTHLILNGEIITQAPSLRGAQIIVTPPEAGSWKVTAVIIAGIWSVVSASKDTVPGALIFSAYDYVVSETLGFHPTFEKALGVQYQEYLAKKKITREKMDSLIEKTEISVADMHRPIIGSKSATQANLIGFDDSGKKRAIGPNMTVLTYEHIASTKRESNEITVSGSISSFNINTYKGRIFVFDEARPVPFELSSEARTVQNMVEITTSLRSNASNPFSRSGAVDLTVRRLVSSTGRLKSLIVEGVKNQSTRYDN